MNVRCVQALDNQTLKAFNLEASVHPLGEGGLRRVNSLLWSRADILSGVALN
jgi:hypothetical protein